ncbi:hypothetical protein SS50377_23860 [Spironucleus salmonicida]|uniref:Myb-like domain-containing protein n=1 Tax=Spironucleus salmonicida TaxID=348837 RepID=A0A9P8LT72_9EUKA|nr:hypothetical protein SS50377_23860 [Spironucleus salmonicida]
MSKRKLHMWSHEDEQKLIETILQRGLNWKHICQDVFPNVSPSGVKNMYYLLLKTDERFKEYIQFNFKRKSTMQLNNNKDRQLKKQPQENSHEFQTQHDLEL